jgi:hypothetical protein
VVGLPGAGLARSEPPEIDAVVATLRLVTANAYFFVEDGVDLDQERLERAGQQFEEVYARVHDTFGRERSPGVDGDPRITVLLASLQNIGGYVSGDDGYPRAASPLSNEREMVYLDASTALASDETSPRSSPTSSSTWCTSASTPTRRTGCRKGSVAAEAWVENWTSGADLLRATDVQLNAWDPEGFYEPHYGASGLFFRYLVERTSGPSALRDVVSEPEDGVAGIEAFLGEHLPGVSLEDFFADWATANYLDLDEGPYGYRDVSVQAEASESLSGTGQGEGSVHQFAADYVEVEPAGDDAVVTFDGAATVVPALAPTAPRPLVVEPRRRHRHHPHASWT